MKKLIVIVAFLFAGFAILVDRSPRHDSPGAIAERGDEGCTDTRRARLGALLYSRESVKAQLLDPDGADFTDFGESSVIWEARCQFLVVSSVRATNAFGAFIRTPYSVEMEYLPGPDTYRATGLVIN